jgi:F-type H+-transporting ATPase subunit epsilon
MNSSELLLTIITPERRVAEKRPVSSVVLTSSEGQIEILPGHCKYVGSLETGGFSFRSVSEGSKVERGFISTGVVEVLNTQGSSVTEVRVFAETLELQSEIDLERARVALKKAQEALTGASLDPHQFNKYQLKLQRALVRQSVGAGKN